MLLRNNVPLAHIIRYIIVNDNWSWINDKTKPGKKYDIGVSREWGFYDRDLAVVSCKARQRVAIRDRKIKSLGNENFFQDLRHARNE